MALSLALEFCIVWLCFLFILGLDSDNLTESRAGCVALAYGLFGWLYLSYYADIVHLFSIKAIYRFLSTPVEYI